LNVPEGFVVNVFAKDLEVNQTRWLALTPNGDVLVTDKESSQILLLQDTDGDGVVDDVKTFGDDSNGLNRPFGIAFSRDSIYIGNLDGVRRYDYTDDLEQISGNGEKIYDIPPVGHWTRNVAISQDRQKLYVAVGAEETNGTETEPHATIQEMNLDGSNQRTYVSGVRNPIGLAFHPNSGELYATVMERDAYGDDLVPDYFTRIERGDFFGFPYSYLSANNLDPWLNPEGVSVLPSLVAQTKTPDILFQAHSTPIGMQFYNGNTFPECYWNGAFVAFHGSWNRDVATGYKVVFVPFNKVDRPMGHYMDFLTGFLVDANEPRAFGRPAGLLVLNDGSLLVSDDENGVIYRVQYEGIKS